jgi:hypothetical protein
MNSMMNGIVGDVMWTVICAVMILVGAFGLFTIWLWKP